MRGITLSLIWSICNEDDDDGDGDDDVDDDNVLLFACASTGREGESVRGREGGRAREEREERRCCLISALSRCSLSFFFCLFCCSCVVR